MITLKEQDIKNPNLYPEAYQYWADYKNNIWTRKERAFFNAQHPIVREASLIEWAMATGLHRKSKKEFPENRKEALLNSRLFELDKLAAMSNFPKTNFNPPAEPARNPLSPYGSMRIPQPPSHTKPLVDIPDNLVWIETWKEAKKWARVPDYFILRTSWQLPFHGKTLAVAKDKDDNWYYGGGAEVASRKLSDVAEGKKLATPSLQAGFGWLNTDKYSATENALISHLDGGGHGASALYPVYGPIGFGAAKSMSEKHSSSEILVGTAGVGYGAGAMSKGKSPLEYGKDLLKKIQDWIPGD